MKYADISSLYPLAVRPIYPIAIPRLRTKEFIELVEILRHHLNGDIGIIHIQVLDHAVLVFTTAIGDEQLVQSLVAVGLSRDLGLGPKAIRSVGLTLSVVAGAVAEDGKLRFSAGAGGGLVVAHVLSVDIPAEKTRMERTGGRRNVPQPLGILLA